MRYPLIYSLCLLLFSACTKEQPVATTPHTVMEQVAVLKIDYLTTTFEGGTELPFAPQPTFTIAPTYRAPGDFGNLTLHYQEANARIFDGDIHWMGRGNLHYPTTFRAASTFPTTTPLLMMPVFEEILYGNPSALSGNTTDLWNVLKNLEVVKDYLASNPNGKIHYVLYTPSVGMGDPADWDWMIFLRS